MRGDVAPGSEEDSGRAIRILAKSMCRELQSAGYGRTHVVRLATELLGMVVSAQSADEVIAAEADSLDASPCPLTDTVEQDSLARSGESLRYVEPAGKETTRVFVFPGQGAQKIGMAADLFERFPAEVAAANAVLGYSLEELCSCDDGRLDRTEYTQPALYVVNALHYLDRTAGGERPDYVAGHSLGEYSALFAAGAFDFLTGLRIVQKRGELMAKAHGGGMAAVMNVPEAELRAALKENGFDGVDIASLNAPSQIVISGPREEIEHAGAFLTETFDAHVQMLRVSGAFHSRYMAVAAGEFRSFLRGFQFKRLSIPVLSNASACPYEDDDIVESLVAQMWNPVRWTEIVRRFLSLENATIEEVGPGKTLSSLIRRVRLQVESEVCEAEAARVTAIGGLPVPTSSTIHLVAASEDEGLRSEGPRLRAVG
jgi:trans-AT polyketide synthase, acyltransferase and oxidoreductase domains